MQYFRAAAVDYDFTLTGSDEAAALEAIARARRAGLKVVLVTGRILGELRADLPGVDDLFDAIVGENGGVLSLDGRERPLARPVDPELHAALQARGVPVRRGSVLLATDAANDVAVLEESRRLGLEVQLVRNREALMVLPPAVGKGAGVHQALGELGVSFHNTVAIGDAENDHSLLDSCEVGVAVANAVASLKRHADLVLGEPDGRGVVGLLDRLCRGELVLHPRRWQIELGVTAAGERVLLPASQLSVLISGPSGAGKSYLAGLIAERLLSLEYSICVLDPEGDHVALGRHRGVVVLDPPPAPDALCTHLKHRFGSVVVDLSLLPAAEKRGYMHEALAALSRLRDENGLPHWIIVDEAQVPIGTDGLVEQLVGSPARGCCLVTWRPHEIAAALRAAIDVEVCVTDCGRATLASAGTIREFAMDVRRTLHIRHWHKYVAAQMPPHRRFVFRTPAGPTGHFAGNLDELHHEIERCSPEVVRHHAVHGDFSCWIRTSLQDAALAEALEAVEERAGRAEPVEATRRGLLDAIGRRYGLEPSAA